ncbi:DinB family protein [Poritiphilus flavus]|uniref:DUF664 domain-containing protein n=1 Tax=Poritiphilus flavus TaxID=2697053 RepID=A0A6L9EEK4_9FLAO|nr:DinB family protein [Poritiphilus flavus]NAS13190.1 DUF664 domain-containing protein [Poritiphilus flavus]
MTLKIAQVQSILENTPQVIADLLSDLDDALVLSNEGGDSWSPYDVLGHLIHGEKTDWMVRTEIILGDNEDKRFEPFDRFAQFQASQGKSLSQLLEEFRRLRKNNLLNLKSKDLSDKELERTGIHPEFGAVSLRQLLSAWAVHDLGHIAQISRVMAKQFTDEVGPWPKYLTILNYTPSE